MGCFTRLLIGLAILGIIAGAAWVPVKKRIAERNKPVFKTEKVSRGEVVSYVYATGKIKPVETIKIGSFVSGPIQDMPEDIDFNKRVKKNDLMARVDPRLIESQAKSAEASLSIRRGEVDRTKAQLQLAINDEQRAIKLREKDVDFVSQAEMDRLRFAREQLEAALEIAEASVEQADAQLAVAKVNLGYTDILAPKDGIIIDRKIEPGQTLAAQFQTPELFEIGVDMDKLMHIYASVDESEIGRILQAKESQQPVTFTVFAYPEESFEGRILQVRMSATETQNVVTYPVIVEAPNVIVESGEDGQDPSQDPDFKLYPNMTAELSFKIEEHQDALRVPKQALRYIPEKQFVREEDHKILDGSAWKRPDEDEEDIGPQSAEARAEAKRQRDKRHVWVKEGEKLKAIEVTTGISGEGKLIEVVSGDLQEDQEVVIGVEPKKTGWF